MATIHPKKLTPVELQEIQTRALSQLGRRSADDPGRDHDVPQSQSDRLLLLRHIAALVEATR